MRDMNTAALLLTVFGSLLGIGGFYGAYLSIQRVQSAAVQYDFSQKLSPLVIAVILFLLSWYCWAELRNDLGNKLIYTKQINHQVLSQNKIIKLNIPLSSQQLILSSNSPNILAKHNSALLLDIKPVDKNREAKKALSYSVQIKNQDGAIIFSQSREHRLFEAKAESNEKPRKETVKQHWLDLPAIHLNPHGRYFTLLLSEIDVTNTDLSITVTKQ